MSAFRDPLLRFECDVVDFADIGEWPCLQSSTLMPFIGKRVEVFVFDSPPRVAADLIALEDAPEKLRELN